MWIERMLTIGMVLIVGMGDDVKVRGEDHHSWQMMSSCGEKAAEGGEETTTTITRERGIINKNEP